MAALGFTWVPKLYSVSTAFGSFVSLCQGIETSASLNLGSGVPYFSTFLATCSLKEPS